MRAVSAAAVPGRPMTDDAENAGATNIFSQALAKLEKVSQRIQSPLAIVGGLAGIYYQSMVTTLDIDIVVASDRLDDFLRECVAEGLEIARRSDDRLAHGRVSLGNGNGRDSSRAGGWKKPSRSRIRSADAEPRGTGCRQRIGLRFVCRLGRVEIGRQSG